MGRWLFFAFYANSIASTDYMIGPDGTGLCASVGMLPLNASQCQDAATKLSKTWLGSFVLNIDIGCKLTQGSVTFNKPGGDPSKGSHVGISSVCTLSHTTTSGSNAGGVASGRSPGPGGGPGGGGGVASARTPGPGGGGLSTTVTTTLFLNAYNPVLGPVGTGLCSVGMLPLDIAQCQDAATKLGKRWMGSFVTNLTVGCKHIVSGSVFFNKAGGDPSKGSNASISSVCTAPITTLLPTTTPSLLTTTVPSSGSCAKDLITCRVDHSFDKYEYYVNGSSAKSVCRSPAGVRSRLGDNITFNISVCKPLVQETLTHRFTSVTLIPVLPWIIFSRRIPGPVTCVCALALSKTLNRSLNDLSAQEEEEKRQFEVDGFVMQLTGPPNTTGKFIIDISSRLLPVVRIESCKISDGGLNELYLIKNFSLLLEADWNHMKQLRANISNLSQSLSSWQLQMRSFALPEQARIFFSCTVHHCAQQDPCPRTARRLITAELPKVTNHLRKRQLSDSPSVGLLKTSMVGDSNGVALEFLQGAGMNRPSSSSPTVIMNGDSNGVVLNFSHSDEMSRRGRSTITTTMTHVSLSLTNQIERPTSTVYVDAVSCASSQYVAQILVVFLWHSL